MTFDFPALQQKIVAAATQAVQEVTQRLGDDEIRAFALYSDSRAMTVCPAFATRSYLNAIQQDGQDESLYYKYSTSEWPLEAVGAEAAFGEICTLVREHVFSLEDDDKVFMEFKTNLMNTCVASAKVLRDTVLADRGDDFLVLVTISDDDEPKRELIRRVILLNSPSTASEYEQWTRT